MYYNVNKKIYEFNCDMIFGIYLKHKIEYFASVSKCIFNLIF